MVHKTLDKIIEDLRKISDDFGSMVDENLAPVEAESWIRIEDFDNDYEGLCWVFYRGDVKEAMRRKVMSLRSVAIYQYIAIRASGLLPAGEITHIIPLHKPEPPTRT